MQIHELNNFTGQLGMGAYIAVDNGSDTGKLSTQGLLAGVETEILNLDNGLNARIDNIIAGGDAPSEAEIIDARLGSNGIVYPSLGDAIRAQFSDVETDLNDFLNFEYKIVVGGNKIDPQHVIEGKSFVGGSWASSSNYYTTNLIEIPPGYTLINFAYPNGIDAAPRMNNDTTRAITVLDADGTVLQSLEYKYFYVNDTGNTVFARITEWSSLASGYKGVAMAFVTPLFYNSTTPNNVYDARAYEPYKETFIDKNTQGLVKESNTCESADLTFGVLNSGVIEFSSSRVATIPFFKVTKGDIVVLNRDDIWVAYSIYDENKVFVTNTGYYSKTPQNPNDQTIFKPFIADIDGYIRMHLFVNGGITNPQLLGNCFTIINKTDLLNSLAIKAYNINRMTQSRKSVVLDSSLIKGQDGTFIGDNLWSFEDDSLNIINLEDGTVVSKTHNLGHCNCVDYNPNNNCLVTFGADNNNKPCAIIYNDPESAASLMKSDPGCTLVGLYNNDETINVSGSLCWGESECFLYFITGVYINDQLDIAPTKEIYKILLGMGDNDLSSGGYGTFISGKSSNEYNGTAKIIKTYTGSIEYIDTTYGKSNLETPQGMEFDKYIFVGYGTRGHNVLKIAIDDESETYRVDDNYFVGFYDNKGNQRFFEPEMVAIHDSFIYTGSVLLSEKTFLQINR